MLENTTSFLTKLIKEDLSGPTLKALCFCFIQVKINYKRLCNCKFTSLLGSIGWYLGKELAFCGFSLSGLVIDLEDCHLLRNRTEVEPVFGWDYSDEAFIWPNTDILYVYGSDKILEFFIKFLYLDYPEFVTISSNSSAASLYPRLMGPYQRTNDNSFTQFQNSGYRNGRPIWEHLYTNAFIYLNGKPSMPCVLTVKQSLFT